MIWRQRLALAGVIVIAAILAFPMRSWVTDMIVLPLAYLLWLLHLIYLSLGQAVWWAVIILVVVIMLFKSLAPEIKPIRGRAEYTREDRGSVEALASMLRKSKKGIYFKWLVANRLGKLTYQMLLRREHGRPRSVFAPLIMDGWEPPAEIRHYLEKGLHGSFAEFPVPRWFAQPKKTPLDHNVEEVVEFLEAQQSDGH